jgi:hypothetical protein
LAVSATMRMASPSRAPSASFVPAISPSERNLAIGDRHPPSSTTAHASPLAPSDCAFSVSWSKRLRGQSPAALIARTTPPDATAPAKTLNSEAAKISETSTI